MPRCLILAVLLAAAVPHVELWAGWSGSSYLMLTLSNLLVPSSGAPRLLVSTTSEKED